MTPTMRTALRSANKLRARPQPPVGLHHHPHQQQRSAAAQAASRAEGDISSVFRSLSGGDDEVLPERFADVKKSLLSRASSRDAIYHSWTRLLRRLQEETEVVRQNQSSIIPEIDFADIAKAPLRFEEALRKRGVAVVRNVVPEGEARAFKTDIDKYVAQNPSTKAFPPHDPQVFELYWSRSQLAGRSHPNVIKTQAYLMSFYHSSNPNAQCSTRQPLTYADRLRIRQPGDAGFSLGSHVDGGSVERWEDDGYGKGHTYDKILAGAWEDFDPWEISTRLDAVSDLYHGAGSCSMLRMFQGWLSMSHTKPKEGTLLVNPLFSLATSYYLLRPFFAPRRAEAITTSDPREHVYSGDYLDPSNWVLEDTVTSALQGASPGHCQELNHVWHPHLDLPNTMTHVPRIAPGDYVAWHADTIHAVDSVHQGQKDSSVMYIPACPTTRANLEYLRQQREHFERGIPAPDFPGGEGESRHVGRPTPEEYKAMMGREAARSAGYAPFDVAAASSPGEEAVLRYGNEVLGFSS